MPGFSECVHQAWCKPVAPSHDAMMALHIKMMRTAKALVIWARSLVPQGRLAATICREVILRLESNQEVRQLSDDEQDLLGLLKRRLLGLAAIERVKKPGLHGSEKETRTRNFSISWPMCVKGRTSLRPCQIVWKQFLLNRTDNLLKKNWPYNLLCALCYCEPETSDHILTKCNSTEAVCDRIAHDFQAHVAVLPFNKGNIAEWMAAIARIPSKCQQRINAGIIFFFWWFL
jgi:hypothetical protein